MGLSVPGVRGRISSAASMVRSTSVFLVLTTLVALQRAVGPVEQPPHRLQRARLVKGQGEAARELVGAVRAAVELPYLPLQPFGEHSGGLGPGVTDQDRVLVAPD